MTKHVTFNGENYEVYDPRTLIDINKDLRYHEGSAGNESWFVVSNLTSGNDKIGVQVHAIAKRSVVSFNIAVVNETKKLYKSFEYTHDVKDIHLDTDKFEIRTDKCTMRGDAQAITVKVEIPGASIDLTIERNAEPLMFNGVGFMEFLGAKQYLYSFPRMTSSGTITIDGAAFVIDGISWFDRQFGDLPNPQSIQLSKEGKKSENPYAEIQWIWSNPQLSNGVNISFGEVVTMFANRITAYATIVHPDGTHVIAQTEIIERHDFWTSKVTGNSYPTRFVLRIPHKNTVLNINVPFKEQEILSEVGGVTKFEGMADISGFFEGETVTGEGYVELVGNWKSRT